MPVQSPKGVATLGALALLSSCGDPALPVAHGGAALHWDIATNGNQQPVCVPGPHWSNAPVSAEDAPFVSGTRVTEQVNGRNGAVVRCRVAPRGDQYVVSGELQASGIDAQGNPLTTEISVQVTIGDNQEGAQGTVYVADQKSHFAFSSDTTIIPPKPGCVFSVRSTNNSQLGVAPGRIWAHVQCPHIQDNRNRAKQECQISDGFIVLEDCLRN